MSLNLNFDQKWQKFQNPSTKFQTLIAHNASSDVPKKSEKNGSNILEFVFCPEGITLWEFR